MKIRLASGLLVLLLLSTANAQTFTVFHNFSQAGGGPYSPIAGLAFDRSDNIYGTTYSGGTFDCGTIFKISSAATGRQFSILRNLSLSDGCGPGSRLLIDAAGNLYGSTSYQGAFNKGNVFELTQDASGTWNETVLYSFSYYCLVDCNPIHTPSLNFDSAGNLYGVNVYGGDIGFGFVFELTPAGDGTWTEQTLYSFQGSDGRVPNTSLTHDSSGNLYGTTYGGSAVGGNAFELTPVLGGGWGDSTIYGFGQVNAYPSALVSDNSGNLYGATDYGGGFNKGTVFELSKGANGIWTQKILHAFHDVGDGNYPDISSGPLLLDKARTLWGTTAYGGLVDSNCSNGYGTIFRLTPNSKGTWNQIDYNLPTDLSCRSLPNQGLVFDQHGNLYGTTVQGGTAGQGTVFEFTP